MKHPQLEHLIRAVASITRLDRLVIVGSQPVLGAYPDAPDDLLLSMQADFVPWDDPALADLIDGTVGEDSPFHETFGYYAQGLSPETAVLPAGWEGRLVAVANANAGGAAGLCLDPHDLALSKYAAGREQDLRFTASLARPGLVRRDTLLGRVGLMPVPPDAASRIAARIERDFAKSGSG